MSNKINSNSPAFPDNGYEGLTKREYFTALAVQGIMAGISTNESPDSIFFVEGYMHGGKIAKMAVDIADETIAELKKSNHGKAI